ncbi:MAG: hypothetical protein NT080_12250 [Spirochaetes bacterium]|nr:hypothetical protein [Spirochaetota bacterium]
MSLSEILESEPFTGIQRYRSDPPQDAVAFTGTPRKHPYAPEKLLFISEPFGESPGIFEFRLSDIVSVEELPSPILENGMSYSVVRLWVRRGSVGMRYDPFEVDDPPHFYGESTLLHEKLSKIFKE